MSHRCIVSDAQFAKAILIADDLWQHTNFRRDKSLKLLTKIYQNIKNNPNQRKYRQLNMRKISSKTNIVPQVRQILLCSGFTTDNDETHLDLNDNNLTLCISVGDMLQHRIKNDNIKLDKEREKIKQRTTQRQQHFSNNREKRDLLRKQIDFHKRDKSKQCKIKYKNKTYYKFYNHHHKKYGTKQQITSFAPHNSQNSNNGQSSKENGGFWSWNNNGKWHKYECITSQQIDDGITDQWENTKSITLSIALTKGEYLGKANNANLYYCIVELNHLRNQIKRVYQQNSKTNRKRSMRRNPTFKLLSKQTHNKCNLFHSIENQISQTCDVKDLINIALSFFDNINNNNSNRERCELDVEKCTSLQRSINALRKYKLYIECKEADINIADIFGEEYNSIGLLNDYHHLIRFHHRTQFEDIYNTINNSIYNGRGCNSSNCLIITRNRRNTANITKCEGKLTELYGKNDVVEQQIFDMIHSNYMHSFDSARRLTRREREYVTVEQKGKDPNYKSMHALIQSKTDTMHSSLKEQKETNGKFITNEYCHGYRFYYWNYYITKAKNNVIYDFAAPIAIRNNRSSNLEKTVADWYIKQKYKDFKQEITCNPICTLAQIQWNNILQKAFKFVCSNQAKQMQCLRTKSAECYEMKTGDAIQQKHLIALIIYTDYDLLSTKFSETFRKQNNQQTIDALKERHRNYYFLARNLRECVEVFGMACPASNFIVYHGVDRHMTFSSVYPYIKGPFSTTTDFAVAVNFCANKGMVLAMEINVHEWRMKLGINRMNCMDCEWLSSHGSEQEILFCGGVNRHTFTTIIDAKFNINYDLYVKGLRQMTYCMSNYNVPLDFLKADRPETFIEKQIVFRLMSHEFYRYPQFHAQVCRYKRRQKLANEFKSMPGYFNKILHEHCVNIMGVMFVDILYVKEKDTKKRNFVFDEFFQREDGWIYLNRLITIFPKLEVVGFHLENSNIIKQVLGESVLKYIKMNKISPLKEIMVHMDGKYKDLKEKMENDIKIYVDEFRKFGWRLRVREIMADGLEDELGIHFESLDRNLVKTLSSVLAGKCKLKDSINKIVNGIEIEIKKKWFI